MNRKYSQTKWRTLLRKTQKTAQNYFIRVGHDKVKIAASEAKAKSMLEILVAHIHVCAPRHTQK